MFRGDEVLYRVNDTIYQAKIVGDKLQAASVLVEDVDVPEIHWVFSGSSVKPTPSMRRPVRVKTVFVFS